MDCEKVSLLLADYSADNLGVSARRAVEAHLQECPECARHCAQLKRVATLVEELEAPEAPAEIWHRILIRGEGFFQAPAPRAYSSRDLRRAFASAAAAILIFVLSVFLTLHYLGPKPPEAPYAAPLAAGYDAPTVLADDEMTGYLQQHAAASSQDAFFDPVSAGLVNFTTAEPVGAPEER